MADEFTWRVEKSKYYWHPLYQYVEDVLHVYSIGMVRADLFHDYDLDKNKLTDDFNEILAFCWDLYNGVYNNTRAVVYHNHKPLYDLLKVFEPLDVTCYNGFWLFKYKKFIFLDDMGYSSDFFNLYDNLYRECRSVVFNIHGENGLELVLTPQPKFFNVNENEEWSDKEIRKRIEKAKVVEITNKLDGSNQNFRWYQGKVFGSGSSALDRNESWRLDNGYKLITSEYEKMLKAYPEYTFMFEYISPKNPVVVFYLQEQEGLYLFGMREVKTGKQLTYNEVLKIGHNFGVKCTDIYDNSYDDILNQVDNYKSSEKEGWVIGLVDDKGNIFKAKLKITDYVLMHQAITKLISPNTIIRAIEEDRWDDFKAKIPSAYKGIAMQIAGTVYRYNSFMQNTVMNYYNEIKHITDRKEFMIACENNVPKVFRSYVRNVYLNIPNNFIKTNAGHYYKLHEMESIMTKYKKEYCNA